MLLHRIIKIPTYLTLILYISYADVTVFPFILINSYGKFTSFDECVFPSMLFLLSIAVIIQLAAMDHPLTDASTAATARLFIIASSS